ASLPSSVITTEVVVMVKMRRMPPETAVPCLLKSMKYEFHCFVVFFTLNLFLYGLHTTVTINDGLNSFQIFSLSLGIRGI
ncbi:hypothetical protein L9F63_026793, partial [Diploptera punctata]